MRSIVLAAGVLAALLGAADAAAQVYVKLDSGWSFGQNPKFKDDDPVSPECFILTTGSPGNCGGALDKIGSSFIAGVGVGYRFPGGIRADLTYGNRSGYKLKGRDAAGTDFDPQVTANSIMANGYYDLPVAIGNRVKPFVGGGIGRSRNEMDPITWRDPSFTGQLPGGKTNQTAWQLTLGANVTLTDGWVLEIGYRYMDLGRIKKDAGPDVSGTSINGTGQSGPATGKLRANELLLSLRYEFAR